MKIAVVILLVLSIFGGVFSIAPINYQSEKCLVSLDICSSHMGATHEDISAITEPFDLTDKVIYASRLITIEIPINEQSSLFLEEKPPKA